MQQFQAKQAVLTVVFKAKAVYKVNKTNVLKLFHTAKNYFSTLLPAILRLFIKNESHE